MRAKPKSSSSTRPPPPPGQAPVLQQSSHTPASTGRTPSSTSHSSTSHTPKDHSGARAGGQAVQSRHINAWGEDKVAARPAPHPPPPQSHNGPRSHLQQSHDTSRDHHVQSPSATGGNTTPPNKPKRHAPPPPAGGAARRTPNSSPEVPRQSEPLPPTYSEVMKGLKVLPLSATATSAQGSSSGRGVIRRSAPPKPQRVGRTRSLEGLSELTELQVGACL